MKRKYVDKHGTRIILKCDYCGEEYETLKIKYKEGCKHFCCNECYKKYRLKNKIIKTEEEKRYRNALYQKKNKYGLNEEQYHYLFDTQHNKCAICGKSFDDTKAFVDHSHETNKVRGLLCTKCNSLLGMANDDIDILINAIEYLKKNSS